MDIELIKKDARAYAAELAEYVKQEDVPVVEVIYVLKQIERLHKELSTKLEGYIKDKTAYFDLNEVYKNHRIKKEYRRSYDFSECNDAKWVALMDELEELKKKIKDRENFLKALKEPVVDPSTGEFIYPPVVTYKDYFTMEYEQ